MLPFRLYFVKNNHLLTNLEFLHFPENENSTHQTRRVIYIFHSAEGLDTQIGKWASPGGGGYFRNFWVGMCC